METECFFNGIVNIYCINKILSIQNLRISYKLFFNARLKMIEFVWTKLLEPYVLEQRGL